MAKKKRQRFTPEFKAEAVEIMRSNDKPVVQIAEDLGISEQSLYRWARQLEVNKKKDRVGPLTSDERAELVRLRRELKNTQQERDFPKETAAYFASERR